MFWKMLFLKCYFTRYYSESSVCDYITITLKTIIWIMQRCLCLPWEKLQHTLKISHVNWATVGLNSKHAHPLPDHYYPDENLLFIMSVFNEIKYCYARKKCFLQKYFASYFINGLLIHGKVLVWYQMSHILSCMKTRSILDDYFPWG